MKYMFIIHNDVDLHPQPGTPAWDELLTGYYAFNERLKSRGIVWEGAPLMPPASATTVRVRNGKTLTTDGPFAETREWLAGYYVFECADLDEALEYAALIPSVASGSIEVRPVRDMSPRPASGTAASAAAH